MAHTIVSRYIAVICTTIVNADQQLQWQNFGPTLHSRTAPHIGYLSWVIQRKMTAIYRGRTVSRRPRNAYICEWTGSSLGPQMPFRYFKRPMCNENRMSLNHQFFITNDWHILTPAKYKIITIIMNYESLTGKYHCNAAFSHVRSSKYHVHQSREARHGVVLL